MPHQVNEVIQSKINTSQYAYITRKNVLGLTDGYVIKMFDGPSGSYPTKKAILGDCCMTDWQDATPNITGTIGITSGTTQINGTSTSFTAQLSPGDKLIVGECQHVVDTVPNDTTVTLTQEYTGVNLSGHEMWKI